MTGAIDMRVPAEIIQLVGKLKFRFSYTQNALDHSVEVAFSLCERLGGHRIAADESLEAAHVS